MKKLLFSAFVFCALCALLTLPASAFSEPLTEEEYQLLLDYTDGKPVDEFAFSDIIGDGGEGGIALLREEVDHFTNCDDTGVCIGFDVSNVKQHFLDDETFDIRSKYTFYVSPTEMYSAEISYRGEHIVPVKELIEQSGVRYCFDKNGVLTGKYSGWTKSAKGYRRYLSGKYLVGWRTIKNSRYYFDENGYMVTGKREIDGEVYSFSETGKWDGANGIPTETTTVTDAARTRV